MFLRLVGFMALLLGSVLGLPILITVRESLLRCITQVIFVSFIFENEVGIRMFSTNDQSNHIAVQRPCSKSTYQARPNYHNLLRALSSTNTRHLRFGAVLVVIPWS